MIEQGINANRLIVASKGESEPVEHGHREAAWRQNRRVVLKSIP
jgi:outer membrane protein OmpA-like peptidoglycan-associated protein